MTILRDRRHTIRRALFGEWYEDTEEIGFLLLKNVD